MKSVGSADCSMTLAAPDVGALFAHGARHAWENGTTSRLDVVDVGKLAFPSGRVVVRDPGRWVADEAEDAEPLTALVTPGLWRVSISVVHWDESPDPRVPAPLRKVTALKADSGAERVQRWELGLRPGQTAPDSDAESLPGFSVDGGLGCLVDATGLKFLRQLWQHDRDLEEAPDGVDGREAEIITAPDLLAGMVIFECGMGDGVYPVWLGRSATGDVVSILVDLELLAHSVRVIDRVFEG